MKKNKRTHFMSGILMILFIVAFLIISGRFLYIQATGEVNNVSLKAWAKEKRMSSYTLNADRGNIFDSNGMTLAYDRPAYRMYAIMDEAFSVNSSVLQHVDNLEETAEQLAPVLDVDKEYILQRLLDGEKNESFQVEFGKVGKDLEQKKKDEIDSLEIPGINFEKEPIRYYPNGTFASHIIGLAQKSTNDEDGKEEVSGVTGIEKEMDDLLSGKDGYISYQRDRYNKKLLDPDEVVKQPINGDDIYLTLDQKVQIILEDVMTEVEAIYSPERISAVIMNAKTGEVVAMSNRPSYNPNNPIDVKNWYNDVISTPYEPGSTVKMFTWAAAIDAGVYNGDEWYQSGSYQINERIQKINDHNGGRGWGSITYDEGFERSSNVAASKLVWEKLGTEKYLEYVERFDLDKKTDIDLPGEVAGSVLYNWPLEKITTGFGQGSTLTPIQQMKAATAITNGGKMLEPYVIKKIVDTNTGKVIEENAPKVVGEPITAKTAEQVLNLLDKVVNSENGTGKPYKLDSYSAAGKTGTAQIPNPNGPPAYLQGHNKYIFSFLGMAPKDDPELIMYVSVNQPNLAAGESGSSPVSFIFKNVMESSLRYLNIEPDIEDNEEVNEIKTPSTIIGESVENINELMTEQGLNVIVVGSGESIIDANIGGNETLFANDRVILLTENPTMPSILGWSLRDVYQLAHLLDLKLEVIGNGYTVIQSISEGTELKKDDYLGVELKRPNLENKADIEEEAEESNTLDEQDDEQNTEEPVQNIEESIE